jgi:hypothetical protein
MVSGLRGVRGAPAQKIAKQVINSDSETVQILTQRMVANHVWEKTMRNKHAIPNPVKVLMSELFFDCFYCFFLLLFDYFRFVCFIDFIRFPNVEWCYCLGQIINTNVI